ncbi:MAG: MFS transporter, partial [Firmicutes bacterium]|nr:MFS transporter [Bacillota bacterium]
LNILWGARKQLFLTFAPWVLVKVYKQPPTTFATLILVASVAGVILQPMLGRAIDRFGERRILLWEAFCIVGICLGYALAGRVFGGRALYVLFLCYGIDRFLMAVSMARATYLRKIVEDPADLMPTLSMGVSLDHFVSMTVPYLGGLLWTRFGYPAVFLAGAAIAAGNLAVAWRLRTAFIPTVS